MPVLNTKILNIEVQVNYQNDQKDILNDAVKKINEEIKLLDNQNGKISDSKLIAFYTIKLQAELFDQNKIKQITNNLEDKNSDYKEKNIRLNNKIYDLQEQIKKLDNEKNEITKELDELQKQVYIISSLINNLHD